MKDMFNSKRGPTTGNTGNTEKRSAFMKEKSTTGSERSALANMITDALGQRGRTLAPKQNSAMEGVSPKTNVGRGPTKGNAGRK